MNNVIFIREGARYFVNSTIARVRGNKKYAGDAHDICRQIVNGCWNGNYFQTSIRNFSQFWTRDFGICSNALVRLGHREKVIKTLDYALERFSRCGRAKTAITPGGTPFDFPNYAADSLPFLARSLKVAKSKELVEKHRKFLEEEAEYYFLNVFDRELGLVRRDRHFSSMRDYALRSSSTYDNCMLAMLKDDLDELNLFNPFSNFDIKKSIKERLWNGTHFYDALSQHKTFTGDSNIFPFWTGIFESKKMFKSCLARIKENGLDRPFPLKYALGRSNEQKMVIYERFVKDYETDSVWCHLGMCFLDVLGKYCPKELKYHKESYKKEIEKNKNFLEVFDSSGKPFKTPFYFADEGMLWASKLLVL